MRAASSRRSIAPSSASIRSRRCRSAKPTSRLPIRSAPPTLGEHNREILGGLLGLSDAEIEQLTRDGIIGTEMLMEEQLVKEKKRAAG